MYPSTNTHSVSTDFNETLDIFTPTSTTSTYLTKSDLDNIHTDIKASINKYQYEIKAMTHKHHSGMRAMNDHISAMIAKLTDTSSKIYKKVEELIELSYKLSAYEYHMDKMILNKMQHSHMNNHISDMLAKLTDKRFQDRQAIIKLTDFSSKISTYEDHMYKVIIKQCNIHLQSRSTTNKIRKPQSFSTKYQPMETS